MAFQSTDACATIHELVSGEKRLTMQHLQCKHFCGSLEASSCLRLACRQACTSSLARAANAYADFCTKVDQRRRRNRLGIHESESLSPFLHLLKEEEIFAFQCASVCGGKGVDCQLCIRRLQPRTRKKLSMGSLVIVMKSLDASVWLLLLCRVHCLVRMLE